MKKFLVTILTLTLVLALSVTAFAQDVVPGENGPNPPSVQTNVQFTVDPGYTVTIPTLVELKETEADGVITYEMNASITAQDVRLTYGSEIQVALVAGDNGFVLKTDEDAALDYTVTVGGTEINSGDVVATFDTDTEESGLTSILHFSADDPTYAGNYSGTVTFNISIVKP